MRRLTLCLLVGLLLAMLVPLGLLARYGKPRPIFFDDSPREEKNLPKDSGPAPPGDLIDDR